MNLPGTPGFSNNDKAQTLNLTTTTATDSQIQYVTPFLGLAPFLRASIAGIDLRPLGQEMLSRAGQNTADAELWLNLSIIVQCFGQRELGLSIQSLALQQKRIYHLAAANQPAKLRLLMLSVPGDISENTPLDCLLENSDVDLIFYYVSPHDPLALPIPEHDAVFVAICESNENRATLAALEQPLAHWPKPVINKPQYILPTGREAASRLLQDAPGLLIPPTLHVSRPILLEIAAGNTMLSGQFAGCDFPIIVRPVGSHAGRDLDRIERPEELATYLDKVEGEDFFLSRFIDYSGEDGLFRKYRVVLIDGKPYACHMGVSSHWMIHYVNAGMYEDAKKREEEAAFMQHFDDFALRHHAALDAIHQRTNLDYLCIDCAEAKDGQLFIFEVDHTMVVHAMDPELLFPYKQVHMLKVKNAFRDFLFRLTGK
jgi:glutathione synthase/RimK-type ligase-like ATP-grasp enzyme